MKRRDFITLLGAAIGWPLAAHAQQPDRVPRIGVLMSYAQTDREGQARVAVFLDTFQKLGWSDGRNIRIDYRWGAGDADRIRAEREQHWRQPSRPGACRGGGYRPPAAPGGVC
jgi:hypothetical protein